MAKKASKAEIKEKAQTMLMHGLGNVLGYWTERLEDLQVAEELGLTPEEFGEVLLQQADRAAKILGFEKAWSN